MRITVEEQDVARWLDKIDELHKLVVALQTRGTELVEENRQLRIELRQAQIRSKEYIEV